MEEHMQGNSYQNQKPTSVRYSMPTSSKVFTCLLHTLQRKSTCHRDMEVKWQREVFFSYTSAFKAKILPQPCNNAMYLCKQYNYTQTQPRTKLHLFLNTCCTVAHSYTVDKGSRARHATGWC